MKNLHKPELGTILSKNAPLALDRDCARDEQVY